MRGQRARHQQAVECALDHADRAGVERQALELRGHLLGDLVWGPTPVEEALERAEQLLRETRSAYRMRGGYSRARAALEAMRGNFDEARGLLARGREIAEELGDFYGIVSYSNIAAVVELLARDPAAAEGVLRPVCEELTRRGETSALSTLAGMLAEALYEQGRYEDAEETVELAAGVGASDDVDTHSICRRVGARLLARRGELDRAVAMARVAAALVEGKDAAMYADVFRDLGEVLHAAGRDDEAAAAFEEALRRYEQKGNVVAAERTRALAAGLAGVAGGAD
jgi:tetratricopeptide (TPR) repeat protein